jgi:5-methylcytosine-specific restriction enzyme A
MSIHPASKRKASFRNSDGGAFKLLNLRSVATGKGMPNASLVDREIWSEFGGDLVAVGAEAAAVRAQFKQGAVEVSPANHA